jgi:Protein of unknown function (DUF3126)
MTPDEIARVQYYLRRLFNNERIMIDQPKKPTQPGEIRMGEEFIGTLDRDVDEGEVSYSVTISILEEDLPTELPAPQNPMRRR